MPTYSVTTAFAVEEHAGLEGSCEVAGAFDLDEANPQRMHINFSGGSAVLHAFDAVVLCAAQVLPLRKDQARSCRLGYVLMQRSLQLPWCFVLV